MLGNNSNEGAESGEESQGPPQLGTGSQERRGLFEEKRSIMGAAAWVKPPSFPLSHYLSPNGFATWFSNTRSIRLSETCLSPFWSHKVQNKLPNKGTLCSAVLSSILLWGQSQDSAFLMIFTADSTKDPTPSFLLRPSRLPLIVVDILTGIAFLASFNPFLPILITAQGR